MNKYHDEENYEQYVVCSWEIAVDCITQWYITLVLFYCEPFLSSLFFQMKSDWQV